MSKICISCGFENHDESKKCTNCGHAFNYEIKGMSLESDGHYANSFQEYIFILSLVTPIVGFISYFILKPANDKLAHIALKWALIGTGIYSVLAALFLFGIL
ncbi:MAG: zinc ribbon domain-containing protein [Candidatus Izimaplasma sp.]|nr:zinc ribbon domain-containing protein [Candidatus Izimaplasma bacterium]